MPKNDDTALERARRVLEFIDEGDHFVLLANTGDGIEGVQWTGHGDPEATARAHYELLAMHIASLTEAVDQDKRPNDVAQRALLQLAEMEEQGVGVFEERGENES